MTSEEWTNSDIILADGELGYEIDTRKSKFGNGVDLWVDLNYSYYNTNEVDEKVSKTEAGLHKELIDEINARKKQVRELGVAINNEQVYREEADGALLVKLEEEKTIRQNQVSTLQIALNEEIGRATG
jgi:hypothetical protein